MRKRELYAVRISGLGDGDHNFSFELDQKFFASFEQTEISDGNVQANIILTKKHGMHTLHFSLEGSVKVVCDHCLEPFMTRIEVVEDIFVKHGDTPGELDDNVVVIGQDDHEIGVAQFMYEFVMLALPYQRIHPMDHDGKSTCDPWMLEKLEAHKAKQEHIAQTDPRWDALKGIIEKNN